MIRINLLPVQQDAKHRYGKQQLVVGLLLVLAEIAVLYTMYSSKAEERQQIIAEVTRMQAEITTLNARATEASALETQLTTLQQDAEDHARLAGSRSGPVQIFDELKYIMNPPQNENDAYAQDTVRGWDTSWDPTQVWLESLQLTQESEFVITGIAMETTDISEYVVRLASSAYLRSVRLVVVNGREFQGKKAFEFEITANVVSSPVVEGGS